MAFHKGAPETTFLPNPPSPFHQKLLLDLEAVSMLMAEPFRAKASDFERLGMYSNYQLYPDQYRDFETLYPEPTFDRRAPIESDAYERRDYREAKERFQHDEYKPWLERKKEYQARTKETDKNTTPLQRAFFGTPFKDFYYGLPTIEQIEVPLEISQVARFEHTWIVAKSGQGKTQLLQRFIAEDLKAVAQGKRSIVVIDSQNRFIPTIAKLKIFAPGQPLHGKLTVLNPIDNDLALNLFKLPTRKHLDRRQRQGVINATLELYVFMFASLLDREMTGKQRTLFEYAADLMFHVPSSTIRHFRDLLRKDGIEPYREHIAQLEIGSALREFFEHDFNSKEYATTKEEVRGRLATMLRNPTFDAMFSQQENHFDMLSEINAGHVILINTAESLLQETGVTFFGRFFLAMLGNAIAERADPKIPDSAKIPTYVYLDEAYEYIKDDSNFIKMLARSRKQNIALTVAHQWLDQIGEPVYSGLVATASTIIAASLSNEDAHVLAPRMGLHENPYILCNVPKFSFQFYVSSLPKPNAYVTINWGLLENMPQMTPAEYEQQKEQMRARFGGNIRATTPPPKPQPTSGAPKDDEYDARYDILEVLTVHPGKALRGFVLTVTCPNKRSHQENIPPNTESGYRFCVRGASTVRRPDNKNGNFWVELEIPHMGRSKPEDNETDAKPW